MRHQTTNLLNESSLREFDSLRAHQVTEDFFESKFVVVELPMAVTTKGQDVIRIVDFAEGSCKGVSLYSFDVSKFAVFKYPQFKQGDSSMRLFHERLNRLTKS